MPKHRRFGLLRVRSPLLAQSWLLSFPPGTEMFQFPGFAPPSREVPESLPAGCPIRRSADQWIFAPTRSFSQLITSFVASESQGILHVPLSPFSCSLASCLRLRADGLVSILFNRSVLLPCGSPQGCALKCFLQSFESDAILQSLISRCFVCRLFDLTVPRFPDLRQAPRLQSSQYVNVLFFEWRITDSNR